MIEYINNELLSFIISSNLLEAEFIIDINRLNYVIMSAKIYYGDVLIVFHDKDGSIGSYITNEV